jgi:hypothetical protein
VLVVTIFHYFRLSLTLRRCIVLLGTLIIVGCRPSLLQGEAPNCGPITADRTRIIVGNPMQDIIVWDHTDGLRPGKQPATTVRAGERVGFVLQHEDRVLIETQECHQGWIPIANIQPHANLHPTADLPPVPTVVNLDTYAVHWQTPVVILAADAFSIEADGRTFFGNTPTIDIRSDPGHDTYRTLELVWYEHNVEMRLNMYFTADDTSWWVKEIRTYNGQQPGDWISYFGEFFRTPKGQIFLGNVDLTSDPHNAYRGKLHFRNLHLAAW